MQSVNTQHKSYSFSTSVSVTDSLSLFLYTQPPRNLIVTIMSP